MRSVDALTRWYSLEASKTALFSWEGWEEHGVFVTLGPGFTQRRHCTASLGLVCIPTWASAAVVTIEMGFFSHDFMVLLIAPWAWMGSGGLRPG